MQRNYEVLLGKISSLPSSFQTILVCRPSFVGQKFIPMCSSGAHLPVLFHAVSQFTLYGVLKGNKPDFHVAMPPDAAKPFYASLVENFQKAYRIDGIKGDKKFSSFLCNVISISYQND